MKCKQWNRTQHAVFSETNSRTYSITKLHINVNLQTLGQKILLFKITFIVFVDLYLNACKELHKLNLHLQTQTYINTNIETKFKKNWTPKLLCLTKQNPV